VAVGKIARERSTALVSRSGLWLIGSTLLLSAAVLAWAFQSDTPARPARNAGLRPGLAARGSRLAAEEDSSRLAARGSRLQVSLAGQARGPAPTRRSDPASEAMPSSNREPRAASPEPRPKGADYTALLQGHAFLPRVVPRRGAGSGHPSEPPAERRPARRPEPAGNAAPDSDGAWRGWKFDGVAQLDQQTYALMDQPNQKRSRFVREGDRLEDATIARVAENAVMLREADGTIVRVQRVDAMAELLRPARTTTPPQGSVPAPAGPTPVAPALGQGQAPITSAPTGQADSPGLAGGGGALSAAERPATGAGPRGRPSDATAAVEGASPAGSFGRRGRRFRQQNGAGDSGEQ
jgi:hypothetical protein